VALYRILSDRARGLSLVLIGFFCVRYCLYFDRAYKLKNQGSLFLTRVNSVISDSNSQEQFCKMAVFCGIFFLIKEYNGGCEFVMKCLYCGCVTQFLYGCYDFSISVMFFSIIVFLFSSFTLFELLFISVHCSGRNMLHMANQVLHR